MVLFSFNHFFTIIIIIIIIIIITIIIIIIIPLFGILKKLLKYYEGWNLNSGNYLFTTDTKQIHVSKFYCPSV